MWTRVVLDTAVFCLGCGFGFGCRFGCPLVCRCPFFASLLAAVDVVGVVCLCVLLTWTDFEGGLFFSPASGAANLVWIEGLGTPFVVWVGWVGDVFLSSGTFSALCSWLGAETRAETGSAAAGAAAAAAVGIFGAAVFVSSGEVEPGGGEDMVWFLLVVWGKGKRKKITRRKDKTAAEFACLEVVL